MTFAPRPDQTLVIARQDSTSLELTPMTAAAASMLGDAFSIMEPWSRYPYPAASLAAFFAERDAGSPRFAIAVNGASAGAIGLRTAWMRGPYIQFLGLLDAYQRRGFGAAVLDWIERQARAAGERNLWIAAAEFNTGAIRRYERSGFLPVAHLPGLVQADVTEILFRKRLV